MFKNLTSFATVRTSTQAIGFYLAYLFIGFLIGLCWGCMARFYVVKLGRISATAIDHGYGCSI